MLEVMQVGVRLHAANLSHRTALFQSVKKAERETRVLSRVLASSHVPDVMCFTFRLPHQNELDTSCNL